LKTLTLRLRAASAATTGSGRRREPRTSGDDVAEERRAAFGKRCRRFALPPHSKITLSRCHALGE